MRLIMPFHACRRHISMGACALACLLGACAHVHTHVPRSSDIPPAIRINGIMVDSANQLALYTYANDTTNHSNCMDACTAKWLPFYAGEHDANRGDFSVFTRQDGRKQWALAGKPLYFRVEDAQTGTKTEKADESKADESGWKVFRITP